jgi:hypothetical protein
VRVESKLVLTNSSTIHKIIMAANAGFAHLLEGLVPSRPGFLDSQEG